MLRAAAKRMLAAVGLLGPARELLNRRRRSEEAPALAAALAKVTGEPSARIQTLLDQFYERRLIERIQEGIDAVESSVPKDWAGVSGFPKLHFLYVLTRLSRPALALETGVANGASSFVLLQALQDNGSGRLVSIDLPPPPGGKLEPPLVPLPPGKDTGWLVRKDLRSQWELILGNTHEKLPELLNRVPAVDLFYHDSDHSYENMLWEFHTVWPHLRSGGWLVSDDTGVNRAFEDFQKESGGSGRAWSSFEDLPGRRFAEFGVLRR